jgi:DNA/RNA-binding domain of Phe-tRNA-synthetase-like protein
MKFSVDSQIFERFPGLILGVVIASGLDNHAQNEPVLPFIREREGEIRRDFLSETLSQNQKIQAWRKAYSEFGAKPKKYRSSIESLYRMILKGHSLRSINTLVDIYNGCSLRHMIPMGGDDLDKVDGNIVLKFALGHETFVPLNSEEVELVRPGEVVYTDEKEILCRRWNWRECEKTKMTEETKRAILVAEGLSPVTRTEIKASLEDLNRLICEFCGGEVQTVLMDVSRPEIDL